MSIASSAASTRSVLLQGETMTLEEALRQTISSTQRALNDLELKLGHMATVEEQLQDFEDDELFFKAVELEYEVQDLVRMLTTLLGDLPVIAQDIRGAPPSKEARTWWAARRKKRKEELDREKEEAKAAKAAEKAAAAAEREAAKAVA
jgi:hypothetical protein